MRHDRPELRRDDIEPLGGFLADHVHGRAAAGQDVSSGSIVTCTRGRWAGRAPRLARRFSAASASALLILLVVGGLDRGDGLLDILERQGELVRVELLGPTAELHALQLTQEMLQAIDLRQRLVARRTRLVALGERGREPRLQLGDSRSAADSRSRSRPGENQICAPS